MRHIKMDTLYPWVELECPSCGQDLDCDPEDVCPGMSCFCGYRMTKADLADRATLYGPDSDE